MDIIVNTLSVIRWPVSPEIFSIGPVPIRWYGLLFALGFLVGQIIMQRIFKQEGKPGTDIDVLTFYMIVSTVVGARLGHCLFYQPDEYLRNPLDILKIWEGGLASHGATVGILLGIYLYSRKRADQSYLWVLDRIVIVVALGGCFIRLGNLMNSEIVGKATDLPWGFLFVNNPEPGIAEVPRHPSQLYEAISCLLLFIFLYFTYQKKKEKTPEGRLFAWFVIILFSLRFFYEFLKVEQVDFEKDMALNMGQILSIPMIFVGLYTLYYSYQKEKQQKNLPSANKVNQ